MTRRLFTTRQQKEIYRWATIRKSALFVFRLFDIYASNEIWSKQQYPAKLKLSRQLVAIVMGLFLNNVFEDNVIRFSEFQDFYNVDVFYPKQIIQELVIAGATLDIKDEDERIPLHYAAEWVKAN